jgi:hypothetical protein
MRKPLGLRTAEAASVGRYHVAVPANESQANSGSGSVELTQEIILNTFNNQRGCCLRHDGVSMENRHDDPYRDCNYDKENT